MEKLPCVRVVGGEILVEEFWFAIVELVAFLDIYGAKAIAGGVAVGSAVGAVVLIWVVIF